MYNYFIDYRIYQTWPSLLRKSLSTSMKTIAILVIKNKGLLENQEAIQNA